VRLSTAHVKSTKLQQILVVVYNDKYKLSELKRMLHDYALSKVPVLILKHLKHYINAAARCCIGIGSRLLIQGHEGYRPDINK